jgi:hypothetical protein
MLSFLFAVYYLNKGHRVKTLYVIIQQEFFSKRLYEFLTRGATYSNNRLIGLVFIQSIKGRELSVFV